MRIFYHNRSKRTEVELEIDANWVRFDELVEKSDIISVNAPLTDQTRGFSTTRCFAG